MTSRVSFPTLDITKLVLACFVVAIHTHPLSDFNSPYLDQIFNGVMCVAVPFFFIASGFLCFRGLALKGFSEKDSAVSTRVRNTIRKQLKLYITWSVLLLPLALFGAYLRGWNSYETILNLLKGFLFVGENDFTWPLWYLLASVIAFTLIYIFLRKKVSPGFILISSTLLLLLGFAMQSWHTQESTLPALTKAIDGYYSVFSTTRNGLFEGFFYVSIGMFLGINNRFQSITKIQLPLLACCLSGVLGCVLINPDAHLPFCAFYAIGLFLLCIRQMSTKAYPWARNASTIIYLVHMVFVVIFVYGICHGADLHYFDMDISYFYLYAFTLVLSFLTASVVIELSRRFLKIKSIFGI